MSETSKRDLKQEIIYGIPEFKTADGLVKFLTEGDIPRRKADLKEWYMAGEGLQGLPPDQQETVFTRSPHYQKYLHDLAEIDSAVPKIADALRTSFDHFQKQFLDKNRAQLEEKMKVVGEKEMEAADLLEQYKGKLKEVKTLETEVTEKGKRYDAELARVNSYDLKLKERAKELDALQGGLELRAIQFGENQKKLRQREVSVAARENESEKYSKEILDALTYARLLKSNVGERVKGFYGVLDGLTAYFQKVLKKQPGTSVPPKDDEIVMPKHDAGDTMLDMGPSLLPKPPQGPPQLK